MASKLDVEWHWHCPGMVYAGDSIYAVNERQARAELREYLGLRRLPTGTGVWVKIPYW